MVREKKPKAPRPVAIDLSHTSTKRREPDGAQHGYGHSVEAGEYVPKRGNAEKGGRGMPNKKQTSPSVASKAAKQLADKSETKAERSVAASALAQTKSKGGKRR